MSKFTEQIGYLEKYLAGKLNYADYQTALVTLKILKEEGTGAEAKDMVVTVRFEDEDIQRKVRELIEVEYFPKQGVREAFTTFFEKHKGEFVGHKEENIWDVFKAALESEIMTDCGMLTKQTISEAVKQLHQEELQQLDEKWPDCAKYHVKDALQAFVNSFNGRLEK